MQSRLNIRLLPFEVVVVRVPVLPKKEYGLLAEVKGKFLLILSHISQRVRNGCCEAKGTKLNEMLAHFFLISEK